MYILFYVYIKKHTEASYLFTEEETEHTFKDKYVQVHILNIFFCNVHVEFASGRLH